MGNNGRITRLSQVLALAEEAAARAEEAQALERVRKAARLERQEVRALGKKPGRQAKALATARAVKVLAKATARVQARAREKPRIGIPNGVKRSPSPQETPKS